MALTELSLNDHGNIDPMLCSISPTVTSNSYHMEVVLHEINFKTSGNNLMI
jgi:hypothetical protein